MRAPKGLGNSGRSLWSQIQKALPAQWELDERELAILAAACRQRDDLAKLEASIAKFGVMSVGSKGQPVVNPAVSEARQARLAIGRLLGEISLPDEAANRPLTGRSRRAKHAADTRWNRRDAEVAGGA
jgi:P27 family predicted phage terminase small subunit